VRDPRHAVELIAQKLQERPLTLIAIGPLTNIALLIATHPELTSQIERVVIMGGAIGLGNVTPSAEFNVWADPEAAARVFTSGLNITMVGLDVTHRAMLSAERADALRATGRAGAVVADLHGFYRKFHEKVYGHSDTPVHDALAVAHVIAPDVITTEHLHVEIDTTHGPCRGRTVVDQLKRTGAPANAHVSVDVDATGFIDLLTGRIASLG
jgi:inosine-uridine nucleoside N-ribohydrolase